MLLGYCGALSKDKNVQSTARIPLAIILSATVSPVLSLRLHVAATDAGVGSQTNLLSRSSRPPLPVSDMAALYGCPV